MSGRYPPSIVTRAAETARLRQAVNVRSTLLRAQDLLSVRSAWTRGTLARTLLRTAVPPTSDLAQQWSASGAVMLAANEVLGAIASRSDRERLYDCAIRALWTMLPEDHPRTERLILDVDGFNDYPGTHYEDVTAWFERAVAAASTA
jgi:hypothetical protein